jgi:hypothetical protein
MNTDPPLRGNFCRAVARSLFDRAQRLARPDADAEILQRFLNAWEPAIRVGVACSNAAVWIFNRERTSLRPGARAGFGQAIPKDRVADLGDAGSRSRSPGPTPLVGQRIDAQGSIGEGRAHNRHDVAFDEP